MLRTPETPYLPVVDPADPRSLPRFVEPPAIALTPLCANRRGALREGRWLRRLAEETRIWGHFCLSDPTLARLVRRDPLGLDLARSAGVEAAITMDTPWYGFFTPAQRDRALAHHLDRLIRSLDAFPRSGIEPIPLVKGLEDRDVTPQLDLVQDAGATMVAFHARELLLEHRVHAIRRFVRAAHRRGLHPLLLGAMAPSALQWGPATLAAQHHYVLARRNALLPARGPPVTLSGHEYLPGARRFVGPGDVAGLCQHNYSVALDRIRRRQLQPIAG